MINNNDHISSIMELVGAPRCTYVLVYTDTNIIKGYITHAIPERFLDILNQGSVTNKPGLTNDFLPLTEVEYYDWNGKKENVSETCLLNKNNTLIVAEAKINSGELPPAKPFLFTLFQRKTPIRVNIQIQDLNIVGQVYVSQGETSIKALEMNQTFIPVTNATLTSKLNSTPSEFDFIAVNKNQTISISELAV